MYCGAIDLLMHMDDERVKEYITITSSYGIEKSEFLPVINFYFESINYESENSSLQDFKSFIRNNERIIIKEKNYYVETIGDLLGNLNEEDFNFFGETGFKTDNYVEQEEAFFIYEGFLKKFKLNDS